MIGIGGKEKRDDETADGRDKGREVRSIARDCRRRYL